ncbi:MAG: F0F1 ATP synthase subunit B [Gammaproteobacteria bacterium]
MNVTGTLFIQIFTFALFVWFCMHFIWRPISRMMDERNKQIADGLAAAERGQHEHELAEKRAEEILHEAKQQSAEVLNQAQKRANEIVEEAKGDARSEGERLMTAARAEIDQEINRAKEQLRDQLADIVVAGAERVLQREIDKKAHSDILKELVTEL